MKRSKPSTNIWIAALSLTIVFATMSLVARSAGTRPPPVEPMSNKPVRGIDVIVTKDPGNSASRSAKTDGDGGFTVSGLAAGQYNIRFQCKTCVWGDPHVDRADITLNGVSEKNFKRTVSKQQLVDGVVFAARGVGASGGTGYLSGRVTQTLP